MNRKLEKQKTIAREVAFTGVGLHSGQQVTMRLRPDFVHKGITFSRVDQSNGCGTVLSNYSNIVDVNHSTNLGDRDKRCVVRTVEHLLAALTAYGIDNVRIQLDGPEIPIGDGSSRPLVKLLDEAGIKELPAYKDKMLIKKTIQYTDGERFIQISPHKKLKITYHIDFPSPVIGRQSFTFVLTKSGFIKKIAPARTFCMKHEVDYLQSQGLARGGSLDNAIVVDNDRILNESLRFQDEFVRHKILDLVGDLSLLGMSLSGHIEVKRGGHQLHSYLIREILAHPDSYEIVKARPDSIFERDHGLERLELFPLPNTAI